jgi:hypothetical protein
MVRDILFLLLVVAIASVSASPFALAQPAQAQPYVGGYFDMASTTTNKVHLATTLLGTDPSHIPSGNYLAVVSSVAGASGSNPSGYIYQSVVGEISDGSVQFAPQWWYTGSGHIVDQFWIGTYSWTAFHFRTDIANGVITYRSYAYWTPTQYQTDSPIVNTRTSSTSDSNFLVGKTGYQGHLVKFFQYGIESAAAGPLTNWEAYNVHPSYYAGTSWRYGPGYSLGGIFTECTWTPDTRFWGIGGRDYPGANVGTGFPDWVDWKYTGTTLPYGSQLWSGSGTVNEVVKSPYR